MEEDLEKTVLNLALPLIEAQGLRLWGLEITQGPTLKVCLYVDCGQLDDAACSANIEQCESISRQLGLALDVENCIDRPWVLEVSSPGLERRFFSLDQMKAYVGDLVEAKLQEPVSGRKIWRGRLLGVDNSSFELEPCSISDAGEVKSENVAPVALPWTNIKKVKRLEIFTLPEKPGKSPAKKPVKK